MRSLKKILLLFSAVCCSFLLNSAAHAGWVKTNCPIGTVYTLLAHGTYLFAGADSTNGVLLSTDNGNHWNTANNGLTAGALYGSLYVQSLALLGNDIFVDTQDGIFFTSDSGAQWVGTNYFNKDIPVWSFAVLGNYFYAGTYYGILRSSDNGNNWTWIDSGLTNTVVTSLAVSGMNIFAGTEGGIFISTDSGASWSAMNNNLMNDTILLAFSGNTLYAATYGGVYTSTDNGAHFSAAGLSNEIIDQFAFTGANLFAAGYGSGVFLSTDNGMNWDTVNTGLRTYSVIPLAICDGYLFAGTNDGVWRRPLAEMIPEELYPSSFQFDTILIGGCRTDTLLFTNITNTPDTLQDMYIFGKYAKDYSVAEITLKILPPGKSENIILTFCPTVQDSENSTAGLVIGTGDTVDIPIYGVGKQSDAVLESAPETYNVIQSYPNPFGASTTITYSLPQESPVTLSVFNSLGEQVATLVNGEQSAGIHSVDFSGGELPNGVYYYRLTAGKISQSMNLVLVR